MDTTIVKLLETATSVQKWELKAAAGPFGKLQTTAQRMQCPIGTLHRWNGAVTGVFPVMRLYVKVRTNPETPRDAKKSFTRTRLYTHFWAIYETKLHNWQWCIYIHDENIGGSKAPRKDFEGSHWFHPRISYIPWLETLIKSSCEPHWKACIMV